MDFNIILCLLCATFLSGALAEGNEVKRGDYPYAAFVYYLDDTVKELNGKNFARGAIIIRPQWLVSAAIDPIVTSDVAVGFPTKTLMARAGAIAIDSDATLYEDLKEQEKEVITLVRPAGRNVSEWWLTDIALLRTLTPFDMTPVVGVAPVGSAVNGTCHILVYARRTTNVTEDKVLMRLAVELQPAGAACGAEFDARRMACGTTGAGDAQRAVASNPHYCLGNAGGPLVCEAQVVGLQTYTIETSCRQPQLFQMLTQWEPFISCAINEQQPNTTLCADKLEIVNKDEPKPVTEDKPDTAAAVTVATEPVESNQTKEIILTVVSTVPPQVNDSSSASISKTATEMPESQSAAGESIGNISTTTVKPEKLGPSTDINSTREVLATNETRIEDGVHGNTTDNITSYYKTELPQVQRRADLRDDVRVPDSIEIANWSSFGNKCTAAGLLTTVCLAILF